MSTVHYTNCLVCGSTDIKPVLSAKDHTVTGEEFRIAECSSCGLRFTQDHPDPQHIIPYYKSENYISHSNSSNGFVNRLYQKVRKKTMRQKRKLLECTTGLHSGALLDMGSGTGAFVKEMESQQWKVMGLEPDADARAMANKLYGIELKETGWLYELKENVFDAVTLWHVLEHVHDLHGCIREIKRVMKENGKLFVAVPNYTSTDAGIYKENWAAYDVPRHLYHFSPGSMKVLMEKHGLKILRYKPMWYDSFYISIMSSKYKRGKTRFISSFFNGFRSNLVALFDKKRCSSVIYVIVKGIGN